MDPNPVVMKNASQQSTQQQSDLKTRLLERIYRLYEDGSNQNIELEHWQKEEAAILITKWRSIS